MIPVYIPMLDVQRILLAVYHLAGWSARARHFLPCAREEKDWWLFLADT